MKHQLPDKPKTRLPEYSVYLNMIARCYNPSNTTFEDYRQRGIIVCPEWLGEHGFEGFYADLGPRPSGASYAGYAQFTLQRIDPDKGYTPDNCRWATMEQACRTRRKAKSDHTPLYIRAAQEGHNA